MKTLEQLTQEIENIKIRNKKVESEKARETSRTRKTIIAIITYIIIVLFFYGANFDKPRINAIVPTL